MESDDRFARSGNCGHTAAVHFGYAFDEAQPEAAALDSAINRATAPKKGLEDVRKVC
jgi:hypothetical protein